MTLIIGGSIILLCILIVWYINPAKTYDKISFKESLDLVDLPIITFYSNNIKLHFLLDTGANNSIINESVLKECNYRDLSGTKELMGIDGIKKEVSLAIISLNYKDTQYSEVFQVVDMSTTFESIKQTSGVTVHGILGNSFFKEYKYVIDFNELVAYSKRSL